MNKIRCETIRQSLVLYAEGELEPAVQNEIREHLDGCAACRAEFEAIAGVRRALSDPELFSPPDDYAWQLLPRTLAGRAAGIPASWRWFPFNLGSTAWALSAAAGFVLACGLLWMLGRPPAPQVATRPSAPGNAAFLEKIRSVYAREATSRYLAECQDLLLNLMRAEQSCKDEKYDVSLEVARARELLQRKRMLDPELHLPQVARARELCDELENLLVNLSTADRCETPDRVRLMERFVERQRLFLRINVLQAELL